MRFLKQHSYNIVKLIVFQIGISIFALVVSQAMNMALKNNTALNPALLGVSIFSIGFYLTLVYSMLWEQGTKDKIRIESGRMVADRQYGLKIAIFAAIPSFLIAALVGIGYLFCSVGPFSGTAIEGFSTDFYAIFFFIGTFYEAFLQGVLINVATEATRYMTFFVFAIAPVLPILVAFFAYRLGLREKRLFSRGK